MKWTHSVLIVLLLFFALSAINAQQQYSKDFNIPLSKPDQPGKLKVSPHNGGVSVEGYSGKEVVITMKSYPEDEGDDDDDDDDRPSREGLKRIPNNSLDFEISEADNVVSINGSHRGRTDFIVKVPRQF